MVTSIKEMLKRQCIEFKCIVTLKGRTGKKGYKLERLRGLKGNFHNCAKARSVCSLLALIHSSF